VRFGVVSRAKRPVISVASSRGSDNRRSMPRVTRSNVPKAALRWSIERAGIEFGLTSATLRKALAKGSATPDRDGMFSTAQIVAALYGSLAVEKLATQREVRRKLELENAVTTGSLLDRSALARVFGTIADAISSRIMSSELSRPAKEDILRDLSSWPLALQEVSDRQTKHSRRGNGQAPKEEGNED